MLFRMTLLPSLNSITSPDQSLVSPKLTRLAEKSTFLKPSFFWVQKTEYETFALTDRRSLVDFPLLREDPRDLRPGEAVVRARAAHSVEVLRNSVPYSFCRRIQEETVDKRRIW